MSTTGLIGHNRTVYLAIADGATETGLTTIEVATLTGIDQKTVAGCFTHLRRCGKIAPCVFRHGDHPGRMRTWAYNLPERITDPPEGAPGMDLPQRRQHTQNGSRPAPVDAPENGLEAAVTPPAAESTTPEPTEPPTPIPASPGATLAGATRFRMVELAAMDRAFNSGRARAASSERDTAILTTIGNWPGRSARDLPGLEPADANRLIRLEEAGMISYSGGGWYLTGKGDALLLLPRS